MLARLAVAIGLLGGVHATGSFLLAEHITSNLDLESHSFDFNGGSLTAGDAGSFALFDGDKLTFQPPAGVAGTNSVLELTFGMGGTASSSVRVTDGRSKLIYETKFGNDDWNSYEFPPGKTMLIPLDGADISELTISSLQIAQPSYMLSDRPTLYIGAVAAIWTVGEIHPEEQVAIVDLHPKQVAHDSEEVCHFRSIDGGMSNCGIALDFAGLVDGMTEPIFMTISGQKQYGSYPKVLWWNETANETQQVLEHRLYYNFAETGFFEVHIPSQYLSASPLDGVENMPYTSMWTGWSGHVSRYAKIQGSGDAAEVVDLSAGNFDAGGTMQSNNDAPEDRNSGLFMKDFSIPWFSTGSASITFDAPVVDSSGPYLLEMVSSRRDSAYTASFNISDADTGVVLHQGVMPDWRKYMGTTTKHFFPISSSFTSGRMLMSFHTDDDEGGLYISPFLVARWTSWIPETETKPKWTWSKTWTKTKTRTATWEGEEDTPQKEWR